MSLAAKYNELMINEIIARINNKEISSYTLCMYNWFIDNSPNSNVTLTEFAALTSNWNPNKHNIGEKAQIEVLKNKFPTIEKLPSKGKKIVSFDYDDLYNIIIVEGKKSSINNIKSFDAVAIDKISNTIIFFMLKTIDMGEFTDNIGGGHQGNVASEIKATILAAQEFNFMFNDLKVEIKIVVDGRSSTKIIADCRSILNHKSITIGNSDSI